MLGTKARLIAKEHSKSKAVELEAFWDNAFQSGP